MAIINWNIKFALAGISAVFIFILSVLWAASHAHSFQNWYTANEYFDWHTMAISHFGVSHLAIPFTIMVCLVSSLIIYFIYGMKKVYGSKGLLKRGTSWMITGYIALMFAFLFLLYQPHAIFSIATHFIAAIIYFVSIPVGIILTGIYFLKNKKPFLGFASLGFGAIAFISGPVICIGSSILFDDKGVAIPEFVQIISEDAWIILVGLDMLGIRCCSNYRK